MLNNNKIYDNSILVRFLAKAKNKKVQKRVISLLSVIVLLATLNQTKLIADTLERVATCGIAEHAHAEDCFNDAGEIVCGFEEHVHTDACYQQRPVKESSAEEDVTPEAGVLEAPVAEMSVELSDVAENDEAVYATSDEAVVSGDVEEIPPETVIELGEDEEESENTNDPVDNEAAIAIESEKTAPIYDFEGRDYVALSEILPVLSLRMEEVTDVLAVLDDEQDTSPIIIEKIEQDFIIYVIDRFAWTDIAVETSNGMEIITLIDGGTQKEEIPVQPEEINAATEEMNAPAVGEETSTESQSDTEMSGEAEDTHADDGKASSQSVDTEDDAGGEEQGNEIAAEGEEQVGEPAAEGEDQGHEVAETEDESNGIAEIEDQGHEVAETEDESNGIAEVEDQGNGIAEVEDQGHEIATGEEQSDEIAESEGLGVESAEGVEQGVEIAESEGLGDGTAEGEEQSDEIAESEGQGDETAEGEEQGDETPESEEQGVKIAESEGQGDETAEGEEQGDEIADEGVEQGDEPVTESTQSTTEHVVADDFRTVIDLAKVETLPLSLREIVGRMEAVQPVADQSAVGQSKTIEEQTAEKEQPYEDQTGTDAGESESENYSGESVVESIGAESSVEEAVVSLGEDQDDDGHIDAQGISKAEVDNFTIDYDSTLLSLTSVMDGETVTDYAIDVVADFESTDIVVNGQYTITLLNGVNPYPAQDFIASTEYMNVSVTAEAGAFPAGTTMEVSDVVDDETISGIADSVTENFVEVERVHAVDICFRDAEGSEIEPRIPISVVMTVKEQIEEDRETVVVHLDNEGEASVVEAAPAGQEENADAAEPAEETVTDLQTVAFTSDAFSVYAVVVTKKIETKVLASDGETYKIEVTYGPDAGIPGGAVLAVSEVTEDRSYRAQVEAGLVGNKIVTLARFFDIKIMESEAEDAEEVHPLEAVEVRVWLDDADDEAQAPEDADTAEQPAGAEEVSVEPAEAPEGEPEADPEDQSHENEDGADHIVTLGEPVACAAHFAPESGVEVLSAAESEQTVTFMAEGFSVWGVVFTVDFYYGNYEYHLEGEDEMTLSALFEALGIEEDAASASDVQFTNPDLLAVTRLEDGSDWTLQSLAPFDTVEELTVTMEGGAVYEIRVEDPPQYAVHIRSNETSGGYISGTNTSNNSTLIYSGSNTIGFDIAANATAYNVVAHCNDNYSFFEWIDEKGAKKTGSRYTSQNQFYLMSDTINAVENETTFIAYYRPTSARIVVVAPSTNGRVDGGQLVNGNNALPKYCYSTDNTTLTATPNSDYYFKGWYSNGECVSTNHELKTSDITSDMILTPVFDTVNHYNVIANESGKGLFSIPNWYGWYNDPYYNQPQSQLLNLPSEALQDEGVTSFRYSIRTQEQDPDRYEFAYWLKDDGSFAVSKNRVDLCGFGDTTGAYNQLDRDTTFIAFFKPKGEYIIRVNSPTEGGITLPSWNSSALKQVEVSTQKNVDGTNKKFYYYYTDDEAKVKALTYPNWKFVGWYHNGTELISNQEELYLPDLTEFGRDLNLTPVFKRIDNYFHVWFDGSNGVGGGTAPNNTFYTRINGQNGRSGSNSVHVEVPKDDLTSDAAKGTVTLPRTADLPQSASTNHFELKGWYDVYNKKYYALPADGSDVTVEITDDTVFYADWAPSTYDIGQNFDVAYNTDTNRFITTRVFDYNNLFNMESITLDRGSSVIPSDQNTDTNYPEGDWRNYNKEYWSMSGSDSDFIFITKVSGEGRSMDPYGRDGHNRNQETSTNGTYYTGVVEPDLLTSDLRDRLFSEKDQISELDTINGDGSKYLGKRYIGRANCLYKYDSDTGYYYYDSDKNAASYNQSAGRFYVYNYLNKTNKSNGGDNTDFLPFNYGPYEFNETYSAPNYWFGMTSEIQFFLPNAVSGEVNNSDGNRVNFSVKDDEMIYKFAGDDDVWVFVDGELVLDMGGIHGKVYGEINFSRGTWAVVSNGANKTEDDKYHYMSYEAGTGSKQSGTINLAEGDHTLTLYYLERGSSQSNCAIYFNIAPRYALRFKKQDEAGNNLGNIRFGVYTDPECTIAADLKNNSGVSTNEFFDGTGDGMTHARNLVAGRTYYIKELKAPNGYPDVSGHVIKLELDPHGKAKVTPPADAPWMINTDGLTPVPGESGTYYLGKVTNEPDMYLMTVKNKRETSITAAKTWAMLDGSTFVAVTGKSTAVNTEATAKIKLQRRLLAQAGAANAVQVGSHKVRLVTRYFVDTEDTPSSRDTSGLRQISAATYTVKDNNDLSFTLNAPDGSGIYSVVTSSGNLTASDVSGTSAALHINGGTGTKPTAGTYTLSGVQSDAVIYITFIGPGVPAVPNPVVTTDKAARWVVEDSAFNAVQPIVTLNKDNNWAHTWSNLESSDGSSNTYYYYVTEVGGSTVDLPEEQFATSFISTTSSDGLSSGTIMVNNTLQSVRVKLRKRDSVKADGKDVYLSGGKYELRVGTANGSPYVPSAAALDEDSMGNPTGGVLTADPNGRFYTGYLPIGTYYLVETEAPAGYQPTTPRKIEVTESGVSWDRDGDGQLVAVKLDGDKYYSLYLNNTVKEGSIGVQKLWRSGSAWGLTKASESTEFALDGEEHLYSAADNGATDVLLRLYAVVNGQVVSDDDLAWNRLRDVYLNPTAHGLTADNIRTLPSNGVHYIQVKKTTEGQWPALNITHLPLRWQYNDNGTGKALEAWYYIEEYGYLNAQGQLTKVSEKTDNWTVTYGFVNGAAQGSGKTEMVSGTSRALIQAKDAAPDTLTVTNGFHGGVTFTKQDETGTPVPGAVFQIIPNNAGAGNYITGMDAMLTSGEDGKVTITGLPIGTYWMWEKTAPEGHRKTDAMYCLQIGYPNSSMYLVAGSTWTAADKVVNPRVGEIVITKTVLVNGSAPAEGDTRADGTYQFNIDGVENTATANEHRAVEITFESGKATKYRIDSGNVVPISTEEQTNSWSVTVGDLLLGEYIVSEAETDNGTVLINATGGVSVDNNKKVKVRVSAANGSTPQPTSESTEATPLEAPEAGDTANAENQAHASFINALIKVDIRVIKIDEMTRDLTEVKLRDAEFTLTQWSETSAQYIEYKNEEESVKVTNVAGELSYSDLPNGKYRIEETGVPDGYIRTSDPYIYFTISNGTVTWTDEAGGSLTEKTNLVTYNAEDMTFTVGNYPGAKLPSTGGPGTTVFYIIGSLLTLFAAFLLLRRKEL